jgi:hypothetical protein
MRYSQLLFISSKFSALLDIFNLDDFMTKYANENTH